VRRWACDVLSELLAYRFHVVGGEPKRSADGANVGDGLFCTDDGQRQHDARERRRACLSDQLFELSPTQRRRYTGDSIKVIHIVKYGLTGAVTVAGKTYNGMMPAWGTQLSDGDIASAVNYIRSAWGNSGSPVTAAQVASVSK
jgi:hypothetical protein